jgi:hypothetical protein
MHHITNCTTLWNTRLVQGVPRLSPQHKNISFSYGHTQSVNKKRKKHMKVISQGLPPLLHWIYRGKLRPWQFCRPWKTNREVYAKATWLRKGGSTLPCPVLWGYPGLHTQWEALVATIPHPNTGLLALFEDNRLLWGVQLYSMLSD